MSKKPSPLTGLNLNIPTTTIPPARRQYVITLHRSPNNTSTVLASTIMDSRMLPFQTVLMYIPDRILDCISRQHNSINLNGIPYATANHYVINEHSRRRTALRADLANMTKKNDELTKKNLSLTEENKNVKRSREDDKPSSSKKSRN